MIVCRYIGSFHSCGREVWGGRSPTHIVVVCLVTTVSLCYQVWLQVKPCVSVAVVMSVRTHSLSVTCHSLAVYSTIVQHVVETQVNHIRKVRRAWMGLHVSINACTYVTIFCCWSVIITETVLSLSSWYTCNSVFGVLYLQTWSCHTCTTGDTTCNNFSSIVLLHI